MKTNIILFIAAIFLFVSCQQQPQVDVDSNKIVLRFDIDTNGNITDAKVRAQVLALGKKLQQTADKMILSAYTEQGSSEQQNEQTAKAMAQAVRALLKTQGERNATNVAIYVMGFKNPIDSLNPANILNRRVEIVPMF